MKTLVLNPGSTSTKAAVYEDDREIIKWSKSHSREDLAGFEKMIDQLEYRYGLVMDFLAESGHPAESFDCVVSRGGAPKFARSGATRITPLFTDALRNRPKQPHPSNLGPLIAERIAQVRDVPAFIYDPISTYEFNPLAQVSGVKGLRRDSMCHVLNTKAMGLKAAAELGKDFNQSNIIVVHIGGGTSVCLWKNGRLDDTFASDEGPFSAERCGALRGETVIELCETRGFAEARGLMLGKGGVVSHLGINDLKALSEREDPEAMLISDAMAYQIAKFTGALAPIVYGRLDAIVFTGGGAYWTKLVDDVCARLEYLNAPVFVLPGENEMQALAEGALRVMGGEEAVHEYVEE